MNYSRVRPRVSTIEMKRLGCIRYKLDTISICIWEGACKGRDKKYTMEQMKAKCKITLEKSTMRPPEINPHKKKERKRKKK